MSGLFDKSPPKSPTVSSWKRLSGLLLSTVIIFGAFLGMGVLVTGPASAAHDGAGNTSSGSFTTELSKCPSEPLDGGTYVLTQNLTAEDGPCLILNGSVTVDGNGHAIVGPASGGNTYPIVAVNLTGPRDFPTIFPPPAAYSGVTVRNVTIVDWSKEMLFQNMTDSTIEDVTVKDSKGIVIRGGENNQVTDTRIIGGEFAQGLVLEDTVDAEVTQTTIRGVDYQGLRVAGRRSGTIIKGNTIVNNGYEASFGGAGIKLGSPGSPGPDVMEIRDNTIRSNGYDGIKGGATRTRIENNTVTGNTRRGIDLNPSVGLNTGNDTTISDNLIRQNSRGGVRVSVTNSTVRNNIVEQNDGRGIRLEGADDSFVQNNTVRRNNGFGIDLGKLNNVTARNNRVTNNSGAGLRLSRSALEIRAAANVLRDNQDGIETRFRTSASGIIERNLIVNNTERGIEFGAGTSAELVTVRRNVIVGNGFGLDNRQFDGAEGSDVDATDNWWGAPSGPSSPSGGNLTDPVTGAVANGTGQAVSENDSTAGVSNVRFDPWLRTEPTLGIGELGIVTAQLPRSELGEPVTHQISARGGTPPIGSFEVVNGTLPPGMNLTDDGVLSGTPTAVGNYTFTIRVTDSSDTTANRTLTKQVAVTVPPADIEIETGSSGVRPGGTQLTLIHVKNTDSTIARNISVTEYPGPWFDFEDASGSYTVEEQVVLNGSRYGLEGNLTRPLIAWNIAQLDPGESTLLTYQASLSEQISPGTTLRREACACTGGCCQNYKECRKKVSSGCDKASALATAASAASGDVLAAVVGAAGLLGAPIPGPVGGLCNALGTKAICDRDFRACRAANGQSPRVPPCAKDSTNVTGAVDPNEKLVAADRFIQPEQTLPYAVHFENVGNDTAQNVTVTDRLPESVNLSTVQVLTANRTRRSLEPNETVTLLRQNKTITRNATIGNTTVTRNETVKEHYTATLQNRTLQWHLENIYLAPNATGRLLVSVTPDAGLPDGTRVENNATIEFDNISSLTTNDTVNIVDSTAPTCSVDPLPSRSPRTVNLSWSGSDQVGEIEQVTILQSTDGTNWDVVDAGIKVQNTTFEGELGETYQFMCVAEDTAGNRETQSPTAEATTNISAVDTEGRVLESDGDPAVADTITVADAAASGYTGTIVDTEDVIVCGRDTLTRLMTDQNGQFSVTTEVMVPKDLAYYQTHPGQFARGEEPPPDGAIAFPRDGSPDVFGLDRFTPSEDRDLGDVRLPQAHLVNVTVVTESGQPVENASVAVSHTGTDGAQATVGFANATTANGLFVPGASDGPGLELVGNVTLTVKPPTTDSRFVDRVYMRNLTVTSNRSVQIQVDTRDADPPQIRQFNRSQPSQTVTPETSATVTVNLTDANPGEATLTIRPAGSDEVVFQRNVSAAFNGSESVDWDGTNATGTALAEGQYEVELQATDTRGLSTSSSLTVAVSAAEADTDTGDDGAAGGGSGGGSGSFVDEGDDGTPAGSTPEAPSTPGAPSTPDGTPADGDSGLDSTPEAQQDQESTPEQAATPQPDVSTPQQEPGGFGGTTALIAVVVLLVAGGAGIYYLRRQQ